MAARQIACSSWILACFLLFQPSNGAIDFFREFLEPDIFAAHGLHPSDIPLSGGSTPITKLDIIPDAPVYFCGPLSDLRRKMNLISQLSPKSASDRTEVVYLKKSKQRGCFVSHLSSESMMSEIENDADESWSMQYQPSVLKIHSSVLQYLSFMTRTALPLDDVELISKHKRRRRKIDMVKNVAELSLEDEKNKAGNAFSVYEVYDDSAVCLRD